MNYEVNISVIITTYNSGRTLEQTLLSIDNQTYKDFEIIIIDGASEDNTLDVIQTYKDKISYFCSERDSGIYNAMNKGINAAKGKWIYIIGADDWIHDNNVFSVISKNLNDEYIVVSGYVCAVDEMNGKEFVIDNKLNSTSIEDLKSGCVRAHLQGMFIRSEYLKSNLFNEEYKISSDYLFLLNAWQNIPCYKIKKISNLIAYFSLEGTSRNEMERQKEYAKLLREINCEENIKSKLIKQWWYEFVKINIKAVIGKLGCLWLIHKFLWRKRKKHNCVWEFCRMCDTYEKI